MSQESREKVKECIETLSDRTNELSQKFYAELLSIEPGLKRVFSGNVVFLNRKFSNMLSTLKNVKYIDKIAPTLERLAERHMLNYGAQVEHMDLVRDALIKALELQLEGDFSDDMKTAWHTTFDEVSAIMQQAMQKVDRRMVERQAYDDSAYNKALLEKIGGYDAVYRVHQRFYDVMFDHPWLGRFFAGKNKPSIIRKQTEFMIAAFGGPNHYKGDTPAFVHMHMYITEEQADLRENILRRAILDEGFSDDIADSWLKMDHSFRPGIVKKSVDDCVMKCYGQGPLEAKKPDNYSG